jgi:hypothetical protein
MQPCPKILEDFQRRLFYLLKRSTLAISQKGFMEVDVFIYTGGQILPVS